MCPPSDMGIIRMHENTTPTCIATSVGPLMHAPPAGMERCCLCSFRGGCCVRVARSVECASHVPPPCAAYIIVLRRGTLRRGPLKFWTIRNTPTLGCITSYYGMTWGTTIKILKIGTQQTLLGHSQGSWRTIENYLNPNMWRKHDVSLPLTYYTSLN